MNGLAQQLKLLAICAGGILLSLVGAYVLETPSSQAVLVSTALGTVLVLAILRYVLHRLGRDKVFPLIGGWIGTLGVAVLVAFSGGFSSDFWWTFLLITGSTAPLLSRRNSILLYALTGLAFAITNVTTNAAVPYTWHAYDVILALSRLGVITVHAEIMRRFYCAKEQNLVELKRISKLEERASRNLTRRNVELNLLNNVALTLNSTLDLDRILTRVIELTNASLGVEMGSVSLLDQESGDLVLRTLVGRGAPLVDGLHIPKGRGIAGWVCEHGETALVHDVQNDERFYDEIDNLSGFITESVLCIPLQSKKRTIGVIEAMNKTQGQFNEEDQQLLEGLAAIAAPAIENALLHTQLQEMNKALVQRYDELQETQDQLVSAEKKAAAMELAGAAAHQLNQPLTVILCSLGMVRRTLSPDHEALGDLDTIEQAVENATDIVNRIGSITEYRTKTYIEGIQILDLSASNGETPESEE